MAHVQKILQLREQGDVHVADQAATWEVCPHCQRGSVLALPVGRAVLGPASSIHVQWAVAADADAASDDIKLILSLPNGSLESVEVLADDGSELPRLRITMSQTLEFSRDVRRVTTVIRSAVSLMLRSGYVDAAFASREYNTNGSVVLTFKPSSDNFHGDLPTYTSCKMWADIDHRIAETTARVDAALPTQLPQDCADTTALGVTCSCLACLAYEVTRLQQAARLQQKRQHRHV